MQAEDTEEYGMLFEVLMSMRKVEACRSSGGRGSWTGMLKVQGSLQRKANTDSK